jgi:hypothetical protein
MSSRLVVIRFQQFMKKAAAQMQLLHFPFFWSPHTTLILLQNLDQKVQIQATPYAKT